MTLYQIYRDAYERSKAPTATEEACTRSGIAAVMRQVIHTCADMCEGALHKETITETAMVKNNDGSEREVKRPKEISRPLTAAECAAFLRSITDK